MSADCRTAYAVSYGEYSSYGVDCLFDTRELAETYVATRLRARWERETRDEACPGPGCELRRYLMEWDHQERHAVRKGYVDELRAEGFERWRAREENMNRAGFVEEFQLWSVVPVVTLDEDDG